MSLASAYSTATGPRTKRSAVAFFDMLGFSHMVCAADAEGQADELLAKLKRILDSWYAVNSDHHGYQGRRFWELKAFTDNVVLGIPVQRDADSQALAQLLMSVASIQRGLALEGGFFVRGGAAIGPLFVDGNIAYGCGLLAAHACEKRARVPRIVLDDVAAEQAIRSYRSTSHHSPLGGNVLRDEDGSLFVNYLSGVWEEADEPPNYDWLERHRDLVSEALDRHKSDHHILEKYQWVARYHNHICSRIPSAESFRLNDRGPFEEISPLGG